MVISSSYQRAGAVAVAVAFTVFLLAILPSEAWTLSSVGTNQRQRAVIASSLHLGVENHEPELSETPSDIIDNGWYSLRSRRQALSQSLIAAGGGLASAIYLPRSSWADASIAKDIERPAMPTPQSGTTSLLSDYNPIDYKTLPSYGRTVFPPPFLPPLNNRATYRYSLGRNSWALEQLLAFANVTATIRTNVIKMESGGLWVSGPLWPTAEYCALLDELGPVKQVVLPTNALEHKAAMKQFLAKYPNAEVWISPGQYANFGECGIVTEDMNEEQVSAIVKKASKTMGYRVDGIFPVRAEPGSQPKAREPKPKNMFPSWMDDEFEAAVLCVELPKNAGPTSEVAFVHKPTKTLCVTDAVICVPSVSTAAAGSTAPTFPLQPIFATYKDFDEATLSDPTFWARTVLQAVFLPLRAESSESGLAVYPGYEALTNRLVRAPILRAFADARAPDAIREWVNEISSLQKFDRIIAAHFASPINAGPDQFTKAFSHLEQGASSEELSSALPIACQDWSTLDSLNSFISDNQLGAPVVYDFKRGCIED